MRVILFILLFFSTRVFSFEVPFQEFFHFIETEQNRLLAPKFNEKECHQTIPGKKTEFNAEQCIEEICGPKLTVPAFALTSDFDAITCALADDKKLKSENCKDARAQDNFVQVKSIAKKMKSFYLAELQLTGHRLKAAIKFMKKPENPNSPIDNLQLNIGDLIAYIFEDPKFLKVEEADEGFEVKIKNEKRLMRKLRWRFNLKQKSEQRAAIRAIKAIFEDGNSIVALEFLGSDFVLKNLMKNREIVGDPGDALRKMKYASLAKLQNVLGKETIDPEYVIGSNVSVTADQDELLSEVLTLEALTSRLSPSDLEILSKSNFPKKRFYNRTNFERDWSDPVANRYVTTLQHLQELTNLYVGDEETVRDSDLYPFLTAMFGGLELLPTKTELDKIKEKIPGFIDDFFEEFNKEFSTESTGIIKGEVGKLHINYPESKEEYLKKIEDWLDYRKAVADNSLTQLRDPNNKRAVAFFGRQYLQGLLTKQGTEGEIAFLTPLVSVNPIPDFYIGRYNGIKMGAFAVTEFDKAGKQVLAHELGHHVGHFMEENPLSVSTTDEFKSVRQCLASAHPDEESKVSMKLKSLRRRTHKWKENKYTEEDFADWIGAKTSDQNMACLFVKNLDVTVPKAELFKNQYAKDPHASAFFRLVNVELQQKGRLPKSCDNNVVKLCPETQDK